MKVKTLSHLVLLALSLSVLTACHSFVTEINSNGSGEVRKEVPASKEQVQANPDNFCAAADPGFSLTTEKRGDTSWCIYTAAFANLSDLQSVYAGLPGETLTINQLELRDGTLTYDVSLEASQTEEFTWKLTLPGKITSNNADSVEGQTLTWKIAKGGGVIRLQAESVIQPSAAKGQ